MVTKSRPADAERTDRLLLAFRNADSPEVRAFLDDHPFLLPLLERVGPAVRRFFGPDAVVSLTVDHDREAAANQELHAVVETGWPAADALSRLATFDDQWWLDELPAARGKLSITLAAT